MNWKRTGLDTITLFDAAGKHLAGASPRTPTAAEPLPWMWWLYVDDGTPTAAASEESAKGAAEDASRRRGP